jgi:glycosyltransferase involved in cell wall biosynthesis
MLLPRAIESALAQTVECEVIVVDHGSTDDTPRVIQQYLPQVQYIRRVEDCGPIFAWLDGVMNASGEYIHLTYDDDWIDADFMRRCLGLFEEECAFVFTATHIHFEDGVIRDSNDGLFATGVHPKGGIERILLNMRKTLSPGSGVFRKADIIAAMNPSTLPDGRAQYHGAGPDLLMYLLPLLRYSKFGYIDEPLAHFFGHAGSITISAMKHSESEQRLEETYANVRRYYLGLKYIRALRVGDAIYAVRMLPVRLVRKVRSIYQRMGMSKQHNS